MIMFSARLLTPSTRLTNPVTPTATKIPISARTMGTPAATAAPNTTTSTTSAIGSPIISPFARSLFVVSAIAWLMLPVPTVFTVNPAVSRESRSFTSGATVSGASTVFPAMPTGMIVLWRSAETSDASLPSR